MPSEAVEAASADLRALGGQRVWSLMVSVFGDLARAPGQAIPGPVLSQIMTGLRIKPEATRVALHRLRKEGWITSEKTGRISLHRLTDLGRGESNAASPRIYAPPPEAGAGWQLIVVEKDTEESRQHLAAQGFVSVMPRVFAGPPGAAAPKGALALPGGPVPEWLPAALMPVSVETLFAQLHAVLDRLSTALDAAPVDDSLETAVLRCLIVHNWRRLVLKHPPLPPALQSGTCPMAACHQLVHDLLTRLPRPDPAKIGAEQQSN